MLQCYSVAECEYYRLQHNICDSATWTILNDKTMTAKQRQKNEKDGNCAEQCDSVSMWQLSVLQSVYDWNRIVSLVNITVEGSCVLPKLSVVASQRLDLSVAQLAPRGCTRLHKVVRCRNHPTEMQMKQE